VLKTYFEADPSYKGTGADPDLYNFFCQRYRRLLATGGSLAVVLPRAAFLVKGSTAFRRWLFDATTVDRIDFLLNNRRWIFDTHPQYTITLFVARAGSPSDDHRIEVAGVAASLTEFLAQSMAAGIALDPAALGPLLEVPLLPSQKEADLLAKMRTFDRFPTGTGRWSCFPTRELHETDDQALWRDATVGVPLWKGESFDQFDPHGAEARLCPLNDSVTKRAYRPKAGSESTLAPHIPLNERRAAHKREARQARIAFRDATNRTNSRTVIACLVPPASFS
jgi:hypothetical protein